jgi:hypothetical protein
MATSNDLAAPTDFRAPAEPCGLRTLVIQAAIVWGLALVGITEVLGHFGLISLGPLLLSWAALLTGGLYAARRQGTFNAIELRGERSPWRGHDRWLGAGVLGILAATALTALASAPNNWDSMTYHLPRVAHWLEQGTVAHYPTHITRQLYPAPWAEFAVLHLQAVLGSDHLANLVQWAAMVGCCVVVGSIARHLGLDAYGQLATAVLVVTIPMGILQASSTQNDYVASFWLVCFIERALAVLRASDLRFSALVFTGGALGLALFTKATTYLFALPFVVWLAVIMLRRHRWRGATALVLVGVLALTVGFGHMARNRATFGAWASPADVTFAHVNAVVGGRVLISNLVRNAAVHLGTPSWRVNFWLEDGIETLHRVLRLGMNDPRTTFGEGTGRFAFAVRKPSLHEDLAGNPIHTVLLGVALIVALVPTRAWPRRVTFWYAVAVAGGILLFCGCLRYQTWSTRLHLPLFVAGAPLVAALLAGSSRRTTSRVLLLVTMVAATPWVLCNETRPLVGRNWLFGQDRVGQYFRNRPELRPVYERAVADIHTHDCREVGVIMDVDDWEYPLWVLLRRTGPFVLQHVAVTNESAQLADGSRPIRWPCATVVWDSAIVSDETSRALEAAYAKRRSFPPLTTYLSPRA